MLMKGVLFPASADAACSVKRSTGALQSKFEGILPAYMRLAFTVSAMIEFISINPDRYVINVTFTGDQSGIQLIWRFAQSGAVGAGAGRIAGVLEWYTPDVFPILFDESWTLAMDNQGTGCILEVDYTMYYSVVQSDEMTMVKTIADY